MIQKYLPEELFLQNDWEQKEIIPVASVDTASSEPLENGPVDWKRGKLYCMEDEDFYREILQMFLDSTLPMELRRYYEESDFDNYRVKVHAMKSNLANIGAKNTSDMAKRLELALKNDNDVSYVQENHDKFMKEYGRVVSEVKTYMEGK